jgi:uncharacterized membrane protein
MSSVLSMPLGSNPSSRWLVISLALNVFFICVAGTFAVRHYVVPQTAVRAPLDRSVGARMERLAAVLPETDAEIMRRMYRAQAPNIEPRQEAYRRAQDAVRKTLRSEPFDASAMRNAMTEARAARQAFDQALQDVIASAAAAMSPAGRNKLADWPPGQRNTSETSR